jgi:bleomycin hydrolase
MKILKILSLAFTVTISIFLQAQDTQKGTISPDLLDQIKKYVTDDATTRGLINAISGNDIQQLALNRSSEYSPDMYFSNRVNTKGITNQKSSGRCWLYTGLNMMRVQVINRNEMESFELSQTYPFFWDQLEKANLFLEGIIQSAGKPLDDKRVDWLLKNPIGDGGQWTGVVDIIEKYGVVPSEIMPDTKNSENTRLMSNLLSTKLRAQAVTLRKLFAEKKNAADLQNQKVAMLGEIYRILVLTLGEPPAGFDWRYKKINGEITGLTHYTPLSFYKDFVQVNLTDYVMFMNDPSREFNKLYEIDYDRHSYEGGNWKYINLPAEEISQFAKQSLINGDAMYFSCDVGKQLNKEKGTLDLNNYAYADLFGVDFSMDKAQRIQTFESGSSHGMNLVGVDLDKDGNIKKWLLENSWGATAGYNGFLVMTNDWFREYMFRLVIKKQYIPENILKILETTPTLLPPWDPMFSPEE